MNFSSLLNKIYEENGIETITQKVICVKPIIELDKEEEKLLLEGDGQSNSNEYKQINSSTGLAVNYFKILESIGNIEELVFEDKVAKPLIGRGGEKQILMCHIKEMENCSMLRANSLNLIIQIMRKIKNHISKRRSIQYQKMINLHGMIC